MFQHGIKKLEIRDPFSLHVPCATCLAVYDDTRSDGIHGEWFYAHAGTYADQDHPQKGSRDIVLRQFTSGFFHAGTNAEHQARKQI